MDRGQNNVKYPEMKKMNPCTTTTKKYAAKNVNSAKVEKLWFK